MVRAFVAVKIDPAVAERIVKIRPRLEKNLGGIRWIDPENLHLTLKFLGSVAEDTVPVIVEALENTIRSRPRFSVLCRGLGVFPDIRRARVLWAGLEREFLVPLAAAVDQALGPIGFAREEREFKPHLTIGRWREPPRRHERLREEIERRREQEFGVSKIDEVILFQSVLKPGGAVYTPLKGFSLAARPD